MVKFLLLILTGVIIIALSAQITIHLDWNKSQIPITGQSLAVLSVAYILGLRNGSLAVLIYLLLGILGLPIFAEGTYGFEKIIGKTGGYLVGFIPAAILLGYLNSLGWHKGFVTSFLAMTIGTFIILLFGVSYLSAFIGLEKALKYGLYPFIAGGVIKIVIGATIIPLYYFIKSKILL